MKNKKSLIAIIAVLLIAVVGVTFAYFNSSAIFENQFNLGNYNVVTQEVFTSPSDWAPGDVTPKTLIARNNGTINAAVRVKYEEEWTDSNGDEISNIPNDAVILNFTTPSNWTYDSSDGYYYYNYYLKAGQTTTSLTDSVTLNSNLNEANCVEENGVQTCTSDIQGLAGATYTLTFTIETCQYDQYQSVWNTEQTIGEKPPLVQLMNSDRDKNNLQVGDEICINGPTSECFNFIRYDGDNIVMLSKYNLNVGNNIQPGEVGVQNSLAIGFNVDSSTAVDNYYPATVEFSETNYWDDNDSPKSDYQGSYYPGPDYPTIYDSINYKGALGESNYSVAYYVENYRDTLERYGLTVQDARLLTRTEATTNVGCNENETSCPIGFITNTSFWLGTAWNEIHIYDIKTNGFFYISTYSSLKSNGVRPVIVISKSEIE